MSFQREANDSHPVDAVVIGAGPCGVAAALQLKRSGVRTLLFEEQSVGGLLRNANLVENYPGFPKGISGRRLCALMEEHLAAESQGQYLHEVRL